MKSRDAQREVLALATARALEFLVDLQDGGVAPTAARAALQQLQTKIPDVQLSLLCEEEDFARAFHYDAIVRAPEAGAVIVGFCPDRGLPWLARGAYRWAEDDLVRVNGVAMKVQDAVAELDLAESRDLTLRVVRSLLLDAALVEHGFWDAPIDDDALQASLDAFRRARGLLAASEMHAWLQNRGLTVDRLESMLERGARITMLRNALTSPRIESDFDARRRDYDEAVVLHVTGSAPELAIATRAAMHEMKLVDLAGVFLHGDVSWDLQRIVRFEAVHPIGEAFDGPDDTVVELPPSSPDLGAWHLVRVLARRAAALDDGTRERIRSRLFSEWLEKRREQASIEWFWGTAKGGQAS